MIGLDWKGKVARAAPAPRAFFGEVDAVRRQKSGPAKKGADSTSV
jgi:hypothetical protein